MTTSRSTERETRPLYVWPRGADLSYLKEAVLALDLPFKVKPFWFEPGKHDKVIALEPGFDHLTADHVYPKNTKSAAAAVKWFFGMIELTQAHTVESKMQAIFGEGTREVESPWMNTNKETPPWP